MKIITLLLLLLPVICSYSQNDTAFTFILPELKIEQMKKGDLVIYGFNAPFNKFTLTPGLLLADTNRYKYKVDLKDVEGVYIRNGTKFWQAAAVAGSLGFVLGFLFGGFLDWGSSPTFHVDQGILLGAVASIPFALIGGLFGSLTPNYDEFYIHKFTLERKYQFLRRTFRNYHL